MPRRWARLRWAWFRRIARWEVVGKSVSIPPRALPGLPPPDPNRLNEKIPAPSPLLNPPPVKGPLPPLPPPDGPLGAGASWNAGELGAAQAVAAPSCAHCARSNWRSDPFAKGLVTSWQYRRGSRARNRAMKRVTSGIVVLLAIGAIVPATYAGPPRRDLCSPPCGVCKTWCCDDYCHKPLPGVPPCPCGRCDDYCRKPLPGAVTPVPCGTCDNYCRKPLPSCPRNCEPWYRCLPTNPAGMYGVGTTVVAPCEAAK